jgi:hypothetical protein
LNIATQIPCATKTPIANEASTAQTNTIDEYTNAPDSNLTASQGAPAADVYLTIVTNSAVITITGA